MKEFENYDFRPNFKDADDFADNIGRGCEVEFIYNGKIYGITSPNNKLGIRIILVYETYNESSEAEFPFENPHSALEYRIGGKSLGEILQDIKITDRTF